MMHNIDAQGPTCFRACLASIFELGLDEIPEMECQDQFEIATVWLARRFGLCPLEVSGVMANNLASVGYHIVCGTSPRGVEHACVARDDKIVFDPHPSRAGLLGEPADWTRIYFILLDPLRVRYTCLQ